MLPPCSPAWAMGGEGGGGKQGEGGVVVRWRRRILQYLTTTTTTTTSITSGVGGGEGGEVGGNAGVQGGLEHPLILPLPPPVGSGKMGRVAGVRVGVEGVGGAGWEVGVPMGGVGDSEKWVVVVVTPLGLCKPEGVRGAGSAEGVKA